MEFLELIKNAQYGQAAGTAGLAFIACLGIGYVIRLAFKIALALFGIIMIGMFFMLYIGIIPEIDWHVFGQWWSDAINWIKTHGDDFRLFIVNQFPVLGIGTVAMILGFRARV